MNDAMAWSHCSACEVSGENERASTPWIDPAEESIPRAASVQKLLEPRGVDAGRDGRVTSVAYFLSVTAKRDVMTLGSEVAVEVNGPPDQPAKRKRLHQ